MLRVVKVSDLEKITKFSGYDYIVCCEKASDLAAKGEA
jgi:hypothetical protein